ncbi:MAG: type II toxin-antitoxin system VapC family toxin [Myxococcales bacterium]|nr:type II toxin-antitoxin system VapC family toxin [Myxococcales bacterium]
MYALDTNTVAYFFKGMGGVGARLTAIPPGQIQVSAAAGSDLERRGVPIGPIDVLIAGAVLATGAVLVTRNTREFGRVAGLQVQSCYDETK